MANETLEIVTLPVALHIPAVTPLGSLGTLPPFESSSNAGIPKEEFPGIEIFFIPLPNFPFALGIATIIGLGP